MFIETIPRLIYIFQIKQAVFVIFGVSSSKGQSKDLTPQGISLLAKTTELSQSLFILSDCQIMNFQWNYIKKSLRQVSGN